MRKIHLTLVFIFGLLLSGCFQPTPQEREIALSNEMASLLTVRQQYKNSLMDIYRHNLYMGYKSKYVEVEFSLPWFYGPNISMDKELYFLKRYRQIALLEAGFGLRDRLSIHYQANTKITLEKMMMNAYDYGFHELSEMYEFLLYKLAFHPENESYEFLKFLEKNKLIKTSDILDFNKMKKRRTDFIKELYENYITFETKEFKKVDKTIPDYKDTIPLNVWFAEINGNKIYFSEEDYSMLSLVDTIMLELLNNKNPVKLY